MFFKIGGNRAFSGYTCFGILPIENPIMEIRSTIRSKYGSIINLLSLRDPARVVFRHWVAAISTIVDEIATQKRGKNLRFCSLRQLSDI
jgi:hypothetical protein